MEQELLDYLFDLRGYVLLKGAAEPELVADLNRALDEFPAIEYKQWHGNVQRFDNNGNAGVELQNIVEGGEPFERMIDHPSWIDILHRWCGDQGTYTDGLFIDECFASIRREGGYFPVHSGGYMGSTRGQYRVKDGVFRCGQVNVLLALTDTGPGDGGTMLIPGSHKSNFPHPQMAGLRQQQAQMDGMEAAIEMNFQAGDALLFVDGISHGASARINPGERRAVIYRYGVSWGSTRYGYQYSPELLERLTPARRKIMQPIVPRRPA